MNRRSQLLCSALALVGVLCFVSQSGAQVKQGKSRPLTTKQLMAGLVKPHTTTLGDSMKGDGPADQKAWDAAATSAALLNESAHTMMEDGRCPDATWAEACKQMDEGTKVALQRIASKDAAGTREAFAMVTKSCGTCHKAHKK